MMFSQLYKTMVNKVTFVGFRGAIAPPWIRPRLNKIRATIVALRSLKGLSLQPLLLLNGNLRNTS